MTWQPGGTPPGTYRYGLAVTDEASGATYAEIRAGDAISIGP
jgi:hypothetical protein